MNEILELKREFKDPKGKYLKVTLVSDSECRIKKLLIVGDFFAFPPEAIDEITRLVLNKSVGGVNEISDIIKSISKTLRNVELLGISKDTLLNIIRELLKEVRIRCVEEE